MLSVPSFAGDGVGAPPQPRSFESDCDCPAAVCCCRRAGWGDGSVGLARAGRGPVSGQRRVFRPRRTRLPPSALLSKRVSQLAPQALQVASRSVAVCVLWVGGAEEFLGALFVEFPLSPAGWTKKHAPGGFFFFNTFERKGVEWGTSSTQNFLPMLIALRVHCIGVPLMHLFGQQLPMAMEG